MRLLALWIAWVLFAGRISGQIADLTAIYEPPSESVSFLLFNHNGTGYRILEAFTARSIDLAQNHPQLTVAGDFTGNGVDELAFFNDLEYTPNMNPAFTCSVVSVSRSRGSDFIPSGSWSSTLKEELDFDMVSFSLAGDYNLDGMDDLAIFYDDPAQDQLHIYVLESTGSGFSRAQVWYTVDRSEFSFSTLRFACAGDFNGNGKPDIAVFNNYAGTGSETRQSIYLFESEGDAFIILPPAYDGTKAIYDFSSMKSAISGDYNLDGCTDIAVLYEDPGNQNLIVPVFEGGMAGQLIPRDYIFFPDTEPFISNVLHAAGGNFTGDSAADLALFYDNQGTGMQEILVLESNLTSFNAPEILYSAESGTLSMQDITTVRSGTFFHRPVISVCTWKEDRSGALSFTFDDGYRGAFEHGGAELETAGLKGTFYIFTDTSEIYDGELASTSLVREYKDKGHEIASHTANHANLGFLTESGDMDSLSQVLSSSLELLNKRFEQQTWCMSIPFGSFRYETLGYISDYFYSARSSQFGFNLATPYDFFALKSWPVLSTTSPAYVDNLLSLAESYSTYLPLMYHDLLDEPFDEESLIYTYSRTLFKETLQDAFERDLWIDTHQRIYKYIMERNAMKIFQLEKEDMESQPGHFSFEADDGLTDSIFDVELTLRIALPPGWSADTISVGPEGAYDYRKVQHDSLGSFIYYSWVPVHGVLIHVHDGRLPGTGVQDRTAPAPELSLVAAPNPFNLETFITVSGIASKDNYLILRDMCGRVVSEIRERADDSYRLTRENLPPGIYIVQLVESGIPRASLKLMTF